MAKSFVQMPNFWATVIKLCFGIVCYSLLCYYIEINGLFCGSTASYRECLVRIQIAYTACVGFTFVIEPAIIAAYIHTPEHYEKTILTHVFALAGSITYIIGGSTIIYYSNLVLLPRLYNISADLATGSMFIITGILYAAQFAHTLFKRWKS